MAGKKKVGRSRQNPAYGLEETIGYLSRVHDGIRSSTANADTVAQALGHPSRTNGTAASKIGALNRYGLLARVGQGQYKVSEVAISILVPRAPREKQGAIVAAAKAPGLYRKLLDAFADRALPGLLPNILAREYGVTERSAQTVAKTFKETMEYAGLLRNGVLHAEPSDEELGGIEAAESTVRRQGGSLPVASDGGPGESAQGPVSTGGSATVPCEPGHIEYQIVLPRKRMAFLRMPRDHAEADFDKVNKWIKFNMGDLLDAEGPEGEATDGLGDEEVEGNESDG